MKDPSPKNGRRKVAARRTNQHNNPQSSRMTDDAELQFRTSNHNNGNGLAGVTDNSDDNDIENESGISMSSSGNTL